MDLASVPWGTRRAIHFRGKMWMARQFEMSGLIAVSAISLGYREQPDRSGKHQGIDHAQRACPLLLADVAQSSDHSKTRNDS